MLKYNNNIIASKIIYCDSFLRKGTGLIFRSKSSVDDTAWIFRFKNPRKVGITMIFVFFPIDILLLDQHNTIVELKENLKPYQFYNSKVKIYSFIELKQGTIHKYSLKKGETVKF